MKKLYPVKKKLSFRENVQAILPLIYDDFMSYKDRVVNRPRLKHELHRMRIAGKPLRYAMEYAEPAFGDDFKKCLGEIKNIIELMGDIHDADVMIPELHMHLKEIRKYNRTLLKREERLTTNGILKLIKETKEKRNIMFDELCQTIIQWQNEGFRTRLIESMNAPTYNLSLVKPNAVQATSATFRP
jgi:CHAD domain-containing protein